MRKGHVIAGLAILVLFANALFLSRTRVPFASPLIGFLAVIGAPTVLMYLIDPGRWRDPLERAALSAVSAILWLLVIGLAANSVLPRVGVSRPLDAWPIAISLDVSFVALGALALQRGQARVGRLPQLEPKERALATGSALAVAFAAMGAVRLNNGVGGGMALFALILSTVVVAGAYRWRDDVRAGVLPVVIYGVSLALLFATSLRGWFTTGHDVQHEMAVFLATSQRGRWTIGLKDAYNACLSITVLPTILARWTRVSDPYVFKVWNQAIYAVCPVLGFLLAKRVTTQRIALLATVYFVGFVGFVQDMPMLNRQEVGFVFFAAAVLSLFAAEHTIRRRRIAFLVFAIGMVLAHYSTTYFAVGAFAVTLAVATVLRRAGTIRPIRRRFGELPLLADTGPRALGLAIVVALTAVAALWGGPLTHSGSGVRTEFDATVRALTGKTDSLKDPGASYALFFGGGKTTDATQNLDGVAADLAIRRAAAPPGTYFDVPLPNMANLPEAQVEELPLTGAGRAVDSAGVPVRTVNGAVRGLLAIALQLFIFVGIAAAALGREHPERPAPAFLVFGFGLTIPIFIQIALPQLSLDYGVGRSFMQALLVVAPFQAYGTVVAADALRRWRPARAALAPATALVYFVSSTGLLPQSLGGYPPQLHLNNSGPYYDRFLVHRSDVAVLRHIVDIGNRAPAAIDVAMDPGMLNRAYSVGRIGASNDIVPAAVRRGSYVVVGYTNVVTGRLEVSEISFELWYDYVFSDAWLNSVKSVVYDNGAGRIYR